jgi:tRNA(His) guanylyltransferase
MSSLNVRMKGYENVSRVYLPKRTYILARIDGRAFHTWTKGLKRPFDDGFIEDMNNTAIYLCKNISGAKFAYVQSDEISILITDFETNETEPWFDNNIQKMVSVATSMATAKFNQLRISRDLMDGKLSVGDILSFKPAEFDGRFWQIPSKIEVENYFIYRQQDATRNSLSTVAQSLYPHEELKGVASNEKQELIFQKGVNWNELESGKKRGRFIEKTSELWRRPKGAKAKGEIVSNDVLSNVSLLIGLHGLNYDKAFDYYYRSKWEVVECPIFTQERNFLESKIPSY